MEIKEILKIMLYMVVVFAAMIAVRFIELVGVSG